jgi:hypothetical protein
LNGGIEEDLDNMTADMCLAYCKTNSYTYAGIEYTKYVSTNSPSLRCSSLGT